VAQAYLQYLYSPEGQEIVARHYFRPRDPAVVARYGARFPAIELATIRDFGGWSAAQARHFAEGGVFDAIYAPR
jgi:sulfate transport system substrate-binding protein